MIRALSRESAPAARPKLVTTLWDVKGNITGPGRFLWPDHSSKRPYFVNYLQTLHQQIERMARGFVQMLPTLAIALVILSVTWFAAKFAVRIADRLTRRAHIREDLKQLLDTLVRLAIWVIGIVIALTVAVPSFTPASAFAGLGIGALAIGFAFQDIFENFLAGVLIMLREKMRIGDLIECEGIVGKVERINLRETHVRQLSNELTIVPNSKLFKNPVKILTDDAMRRDEVMVGVGYDCDVEDAQRVIREAIEALDNIVHEKPVLVVARTFGASSIDLLVQWWAPTGKTDIRLTRHSVVVAVKKALDAAGIEIPYPYVTNTFKEPLRLARADPAAPPT